jgi:hypothetical protein
VIAVISKAKVVRDLDSAWGDLMRTVEAIPAEDCEKPGVVGDWSLKDVLGHIAFWSGQAATTMRCAAAGRLEDVERGTGSNWVDEWNEREYRARKDHALSEVRAEFLRNHKEAADALEAAPEEVLETKFGQYRVITYFEGDTFDHYREHNEQIKEWQQQLDTSEA